MNKKVLLFIIMLSILTQKNIQAQSNGAGIAAVAGGLMAIGAGIMAVEDMQERMELTATQWLLANHSEISNFSLKTIDFSGKKIKDLSKTSVLSFKIQEFTPKDNPELNGKKYVLLAFTSYGWVNDQGIDFSRVNWYLIDSEEWSKMMVAYSKVSSMEKNESIIKEKLVNGVIVNRGVRVKGKLEIPFFKLENDMYVSTDYSSEMKLIYNENSLGIFIKKSQDLVQMRRSTVIDIHEFLFPNK
ncbi:hypothetical protein ACLH3R_002337 [Flavobacterium psychrophilum]|nr:hypothetical protein [Flavobacterium psychrophilum]SNA82550.1 conserved exported hypothetical protein [Flavobacterium psychrophilum]SNB06645.1 conserved exported hypothetical protein [Flavobacterium psychrophilum]